MMIVREAIMLKNYEPGDGTRYRVMLSVGKTSVFVAIGAGDKIEGGYMLQRGTLDYYAHEIANAQDEDELRDQFERFFSGNVGYWREYGHANIHDEYCPHCDELLNRKDVAVTNKWMAHVACLLALFGHVKSEGRNYYVFPGLIYNNRWGELLELIKDWKLHGGIG